MLQVYSKESIIAEKFEAIVSLGNASSRMKDFYDIYALSKTYDFQSYILAEAIKETFMNRKTSFSTIVAFDDEFKNDSNRIRMWNSFLKTKRIEHISDFSNVIQQIKIFLEPILIIIKQTDSKQKLWDHHQNNWN